jgi:hypothetical protein
MESDLLEMLAYVVTIGVLPYVLVEIYELSQRTIAKHRSSFKH